MEGRGGEHAWLSMCSSNLHPSLHLGCLLLGFLLLAVVSLVAVSWSRISNHKSAGDQVDEKKKVAALPPGSMGLPLLQGLVETLQFAFCNSCPIGSPPPFLTSRLRKYGSVFKLKLMGRPTVVSMDPELNKLLLSNEEKLVHVNFPDFIKKIVGPMLTLHGPRHRRLREITTPALNPSALQALHVIPIQDYACSILRTWSQKPIIDVQFECKKFVFTYIVKSLLNLAPEDPNTELLMSDFLLLMNGYSAVPLDLPGTTYNKVLKARKRIITTFRHLVQARRKVDEAEPKDFLDVLLREKDECGNFFSDQDIVEFTFSVILGGFETTGILLTNTVKFISENAHVIDELRKEHVRIRENKKPQEMLTWDDFKQMHFTELVIKEALRMASIVHFVTQETLHDIVFKGYREQQSSLLNAIWWGDEDLPWSSSGQI